MTVLDTSVLVEAVSVVPDSPVPVRMRRFIAGGERLGVPSLVFYEFLRGPLRPEEIAFQNALFPLERALPYGAVEAKLSADLYRRSGAPGAANSIVQDAALWTLNVRDFTDIPGLRLVAAN